MHIIFEKMQLKNLPCVCSTGGQPPWKGTSLLKTQELGSLSFALLPRLGSCACSYPTCRVCICFWPPAIHQFPSLEQVSKYFQSLPQLTYSPWKMENSESPLQGFHYFFQCYMEGAQKLQGNVKTNLGRRKTVSSCCPLVWI